MPKSFTSPCPFVPLREYEWHSVHPYIFVSHCPPLPWNPVVYCFVAGTHAMSYGLILELMLQLLFTFRKRNTFYFWSLLTCILGIAVFTISFDLRFFAFHVNSPVVILTGLGTLLMVGGFNLVLYSRLNLITQNKPLLKTIFISIVVVCAVGKIPVLVSESIQTPIGKEVYRISLYLDFLFTAEISMISGVYIYLFRRKFMRGFGPSQRAKSTFQLLVVAQLIVAASDVVANVLLCLDYYLPSVTVTPLRQAIKVKIEFVILNRLVLFAQRESSPHWLPDIGSKEEHQTANTLYAAENDGYGHSPASPRVIFQLAENGCQGIGPRYRVNSLLRTFRSLPDLSSFRTTDRRIFDERAISDQWSITDIQYLGRFGQRGEV